MMQKKKLKSKGFFKPVDFDTFEFFKFNYNYEKWKQREQAINVNLEVWKLKRGTATSVGNNCLLDSIFQQIIVFLSKHNPSLIDKLGNSYLFFNAIRNRINKTQGEMLSINHEVQGLQILTAIQHYLRVKLGHSFSFHLDVLLADNDDAIGQVDMTSINNQIHDGNIQIPIKLIYVNYNHYEPVFDINAQLADAEAKIKQLRTLIPEISANNLIKRIKDLIELANQETNKDKTDFTSILRKLNNIQFYFNHPDLVNGAAYHGGVKGIQEQYESELLRINLQVKRPKVTISKDSAIYTMQDNKLPVVAKGMRHLAQLYKLKRAYRDIYEGRKFNKAGLAKFDKKKPLRQPNPIQALSEKNIKNLIKELKRSGNLAFGLREDEVELFKALLGLPYKLQHATNSYYRILNSGVFNSYTEIQRNTPDYESPFSTPGNIEKLGNGGFVFFRLYVEPVNSSQTRYGDTSLVFDSQLLRNCGWISLHDQLKPFPNKSPATKHFYWKNILLRTSEAAPLKNGTTDKNLQGGLLYRYRDTKITSYDGKKDTLKTFGKKIAVKEINRNFLDEIFYAGQIPLGITLSVIRELRNLDNCSFRKHFLKYFAKSNPQKRIALLGELIKSLYRIEGKYPVSLRLTADLEAQTQTFTPIAKSDQFLVKDRQFEVNNPDGDGSYNIDLSINPQAMMLAELRSELKILKERLSLARQQRKNPKTKELKKKELDSHIKAIDKRIEIIQNQLGEDKQRRQELINQFVEEYKVDPAIFEKIDTAKLELINDYFTDLLEDEEYVSFTDLIALPNQKLRIIGQEELHELVTSECTSFGELSDCTAKQLEILARYNIKKPLEETDNTLSDLLVLYDKNPRHLECLTCDDLSEYIIELAPDIDSDVLDYAKEENINFEEIINQLEGFVQYVFKKNLEGLGYELSDNEYEEENQSVNDSQEEIDLPYYYEESSDEENSPEEEVFLDIVENEVYGYIASDDADSQDVVTHLIDASHKPQYNHAFEHLDNRIDTFRDYYSLFCFGALRRQPPKIDTRTSHSPSAEGNELSDISDDNLSYSSSYSP